MALNSRGATQWSTGWHSHIATCWGLEQTVVNVAANSENAWEILLAASHKVENTNGSDWRVCKNDVHAMGAGLHVLRCGLSSDWDFNLGNSRQPRELQLPSAAWSSGWKVNLSWHWVALDIKAVFVRSCAQMCSNWNLGDSMYSWWTCCHACAPRGTTFKAHTCVDWRTEEINASITVTKQSPQGT